MVGKKRADTADNRAAVSPAHQEQEKQRDITLWSIARYRFSADLEKGKKKKREQNG